MEDKLNFTLIKIKTLLMLTNMYLHKLTTDQLAAG